jgi:subtilisin family serine protease
MKVRITLSRLRSGASSMVLAQSLVIAPAGFADMTPDGLPQAALAAEAPTPQNITSGAFLAAGPEEDEAEDQAEDEADDEAEDQAEDEAEEEAEDQAEEEAEDQAEEEAEDEAEDEAEEEAEDQAEEEAEDQAEEEAEDQAEEEAEDQAEEEAEDQAEEEAEDQAEEEAEDQAEEEAEDQAEEEAEDQAEEEAEDQAEEEAEDQAEEEAEDQAEEEAEDQAEEEAEDQAEEEAEDQAEEEAEDQAEEEAEDQAEEEAEDQAEEEAEDQAEEEAEGQAEEEAEDQAEEEAEDQAEEEAEDQAEEEAEERAEHHAEEEAERRAERHASEHADDADEEAERAGREMEDRLARRAPEHDREEFFSPAEVAATVAAERDYAEIEDRIEEAYIADEVIFLAEREEVESIELEAFTEKNVEYLEGLDMVLVRARTRDPAALEKDVRAVGEQLQAGVADRNHLYSPDRDASASLPPPSADTPAALAAKLGFRPHAVAELRVGLIDTAVATGHVLLSHGAITSRDFVAYDAARPTGHGTAVASILVGQDSETGHFGLAPEATLFAASVFFETSEGARVATAESLVRALDWMLREKVRVVNMSLSGPSNQLVDLAVRRAYEKGLLVVAAVGNAGPRARPLYPAAIAPVVAVTAVDRDDRVYLRAGRGQHVDLSAPGVAVFTADAEIGYKTNTGTSMAAPFVTAMLARAAQENFGGDPVRAFEAMKDAAQDLGAPGFDEIYGFGLVRGRPE